MKYFIVIVFFCIVTERIWFFQIIGGNKLICCTSSTKCSNVFEKALISSPNFSSKFMCYSKYVGPTLARNQQLLLLICYLVKIMLKILWIIIVDNLKYLTMY